MKWKCIYCGLGPLEVAPENLPVHHRCVERNPAYQVQVERRHEIALATVEHLPEESRALLVGDRIKQLTDALGIPQCGGCKARQAWLNKAHAWVLNAWGHQ